MKKQYLAYFLILIELVIQIAGGIYYDQTPGFVWALANAILVMVPLAFGVKLGLLCLLPAAVSETVWFFLLNYTPGPLFHLVSFTVSVIILGFANKKLNQMPKLWRILLSILLYFLFLFAEEALYHSLMLLFLNRTLTWKKVSETFLSPVNLLLLPVLFLGEEHNSM